MRCLPPISIGCLARSPCKPWQCMPSRRPGCIRTPPRLSSMGPMRTHRKRRGRRDRPTGIAKTGGTTSNRCSSVWAWVGTAAFPCALVCVMATAAIVWKLRWRLKNVWPWAWRGGVGSWGIVRAIMRTDRQTRGRPRPAYGHSKDGRDGLKQVLLSLGVGGDGGIPLRLGVRDGNRSDSVETPVAIEECLALGLEGVRGIVADSKAYSRRTLGVCLEHKVDLITLVPRTCAVRQALEAWGQQQAALPLLLEKPGRTKDEAPRRWHGQSVSRQVEVEYSDGRVALETLRFVVVHSSQLAQQQTQAYTAAQEKEAGAVAEHVQRVQARWFACAADAAAAIAEYEHRGPGRRGRRPQSWRYHAVRYRVVADTRRRRRVRRGRPRKKGAPAEGVALSPRGGGRGAGQC